MKNLKVIFAALLCCTVFAGCEEDDEFPAQKKIKPTVGVFILNQGSWGENDASVSYYDFQTEQFIDDIADGKLGDSAQDIFIYGSKLYVSVNESNVIWAFRLDSLDVDLADKISLGSGTPHYPNYFAASGKNLYVTTRSGNVLRIDTATYAIDAVKTGTESEGIAEYNGKLYVSNTNRDDYTSDNTLSVIDVATFREETKISVGVNPYIVRADGNGDLYLSFRGNYYDIDGGFQRIDTKNDYAVTEINIPAYQDFTILNDTLYYYGVDYSNYPSVDNYFGKYDVKNEQIIDGSFIDSSRFEYTAYALGVNPENGDIYISDAQTYPAAPSRILIFDRDGKFKNEFIAGINACKVIFF